MDILIKLFAFFDFCKACKKKVEEHFEQKAVKKYAKKLRNQYKYSIKALKTKVKKNEKIKVCFECIYTSSSLQLKRLFELMLKDDMFDPFILIIPDVIRGEEHMFDILNQTYNSLKERYPNKVFNSYDCKTKQFADWSDKCDIMCSANPYDNMTKREYTFEYYAQKKKLNFLIDYCFIISKNFSLKYFFPMLSLSICWKYFANTRYELKEFKRHTLLKGKNAVLTGYAKMDLLMDNYRKSDRKKIIIAPHHTVLEEWNEIFRLSNFLEYQDFFLELPKMYPQIDWVFRPHQLLFINLINNDIWTKDKVDDYLNKITSFKNAEYQDGGDYFDTFATADGIIHDCGSFIVEWLYTGKQGCYLLRDEDEINNTFSKMAQDCLQYYHKAFDKDDIIDYIENVVLHEKDQRRAARQKFIRKKIQINRFHVSEKILKNIKQEFL